MGHNYQGRSASPCKKVNTCCRAHPCRRTRRCTQANPCGMARSMVQKPREQTRTTTIKETVKANGEVDIKRKVRCRSRSKSPIRDRISGLVRGAKSFYREMRSPSPSYNSSNIRCASPPRVTGSHLDTPHPNQLTSDMKRIGRNVGNYMSDVSRPVVRRLSQDLSKMADMMDEKSRRDYSETSGDEEFYQKPCGRDKLALHKNYSKCESQPKSCMLPKDKSCGKYSYPDESSLTQYVVVVSDEEFSGTEMSQSMYSDEESEYGRSPQELRESSYEYPTPSMYRSQSPLRSRYSNAYSQQGYELSRRSPSPAMRSPTRYSPSARSPSPSMRSPTRYSPSGLPPSYQPGWAGSLSRSLAGY